MEDYRGTQYFYLHAPGVSAKHLNVSFTLREGNPDYEPYPTRLVAIWLENMNDEYLTSLFVSQWLSMDGYRYNSQFGKNYGCFVCPDWRDSLSWANTRKTDSLFVDAVTRPTPFFGKAVIAFNPLLWSTSSGSVQVCIENHLENEFNYLFRATINLDADSASAVPKVTYVPYRDPYSVEDAIQNVIIDYHK